MRNILIILVAFVMNVDVEAQIRYNVLIDFPEGMDHSRITGLFAGDDLLEPASITGSVLTLIPASGRSYSVTYIREQLAKIGVTAVEYEEVEYQPVTEVKVSALSDASFKVYGNCGMCKERIERAARSVKGVIAAEWDETSGMLKIKYRAATVGLDRIHEAIAKVGHDTDHMRTTDAQYESLHHCCKYERTTVPKR